MEPTFETINLGNDENPCLIKIGSTLNEKERKDLQEPLMEFQKVFAWSYEHMLGIDPEIAPHHIDINDHMVPVKQKLRRMRTEWLLKIKGKSLRTKGGVHQTCKPSRMDSQCHAYAEEGWKGEDVCGF